mgnify:CR=1 FL=1
MIHLRQPKKLTPEGNIIKAVKHHLTLMGYYVIRIHQSLGCHKGITDFIAVRDGKVLFIEVKSPARQSKQSPYQVEFQREIEAHGGTYLLIKSIEELIYAQI